MTIKQNVINQNKQFFFLIEDITFSNAMVAPQVMHVFSNPKGKTNAFNDFENDSVSDSTSLSPVTASLTLPTKP